MTTLVMQDSKYAPFKVGSLLMSLISILSHPAKYSEGFDAPPTLERSGSEHRRAVTSFPFREGFLSPVRGTEGVLKTIEGRFSKKLLLAKDFANERNESLLSNC